MINWFRLNKPPKNIILKPLFEDILRYMGLVHDLSFTHAYKERISTINSLSKMGILIEENMWRICYGHNALETEYVITKIPT